MASVGIVGSGLAGLTAAIEAAADHSVTVYEQDERVGGRVGSVRKDGYVFDRGFQVIFTAYPALRQYVDLDDLDLRYFDPGAVVASDGEVSVVADPLRSPRDAPATLAGNELGIRDGFRLLWLRLRLARMSRDECFATDGQLTIRDYLEQQGFSDRFIDRFFVPFYGGITLDRSLTTSASVFQFTFSMLAQGRIAVPANGMAALPEALADRARDAGATIRMNIRVDSVTPDGTIASGDDHHDHDAVIVATDPAEAERLTDTSTPSGGAGCETAYFAVDEPLNVGPKLVLNADKRPDEPNHIVPVSRVAPEHGGDDHLVSATWLDAQGREKNDCKAVTEAVLDRWKFDRTLRPLHVSTVPFAQFHQPPGFTSDLPGPTDPPGSIMLAGDVTQDASINGAIRSGRRAAELV